jgi:hypothetical protein
MERPMASNTRVTERIRKAKRTAAGQGRKRLAAHAQRVLAEQKLELALGEKIALPTVR